MSAQGHPGQPIAHTRNRAGDYHSLAAHLTGVAALAMELAEKFGAGTPGYWAGRWHDLGKYNPEFQQYLFDAEAGKRRRGPDHKAAGVSIAATYGEFLAPLLEGHHGGLRDNGDFRAWFREKLEDRRTAEAVEIARSYVPDLIPQESLVLPPGIETPHHLEFFLRMLFSALVDADFLDTEAHFHEHRSTIRSEYPSITQLWSELRASQEQLSGKSSGAVADVRHQVYCDCLAAAELPPGFFRLTVPTGGGKTRSGLAFALRHAHLHHLDRVIVAVPYLSITDQTASEYRRIFSHERAVLEHHSAAEFQPNQHVEGSPEDTWCRLASENWDAPLIVTTTVQLFESLFANSPSKCRKLHNLARCVIVLDEAQTLPEGLLEPTLDVLGELVRMYGASVVLSTATQPALDQRQGFGGLSNVREIVRDPAQHFTTLRRVEYEWDDTPRSWNEIANLLRDHRQAMAIVNTRADALTLVQALGNDGLLHLSALLCGAHRRDILDEVKRRLANDEPCLLVATQVVEAGVDIDFPIVMRALGPLDRMVQAAGRCNREGKLAQGRVIIFRPEEGRTPPGAYSTATAVAEMLLAMSDVDLHEPGIYQRYFEMLYERVTLDAKKIQPHRAQCNYQTVAQKYRVIDDDGVPVVVPYRPTLPDGCPLERALADLQTKARNPREIWRQLQPFLINVPRRELAQLEREALVSPVTDGLYRWSGKYDDVIGVGGRERDPDALVI